MVVLDYPEVPDGSMPDPFGEMYRVGEDPRALGPDGCDLVYGMGVLGAVTSEEEDTRAAKQKAEREKQEEEREYRPPAPPPPAYDPKSKWQQQAEGQRDRLAAAQNAGDAAPGTTDAAPKKQTQKEIQEEVDATIGR